MTTFTFIDLFAGIGGMRIAFQKVGGKCVFSSEIDKYAGKTNFENLGAFLPQEETGRERKQESMKIEKPIIVSNDTAKRFNK